MDINEIRRLNLLFLIKNEFDGNKAKFASAIKKTPSYVSRWLSDGKQKRNIENDTARYIERELKIQSGWFDKLQDTIAGLSRTDFLKNQLLDLYEELSTDGKVKLVQFANDLKTEETNGEVSVSNPFGVQTLDKIKSNNKEREKQ